MAPGHDHDRDLGTGEPYRERVSYHVRDCLDAGATRGEIYDALNVAVMQGSGPAMVYAGYAVEAIDEYLAEGSDAESPDAEGSEAETVDDVETVDHAEEHAE